MAEEKKKIGEKLRKFSMDTRMKSSNEFKDKLVGMFKGYIKAVVVWGSITRGDFTGKSDVDIYVIFDDTKMPLKKFDDIRDKIDRDVTKLANDTDPRLHVQPVIALTEFWDGVRGCHPLFYNIVREGYAVYDTGFFIPMRKLLEWGKFPATIEAAEQRISGVPKRIARVKSVKMYMIAEDLYMAMIDAAQAILMYVGVGPPAPKVVAREMRKHLVEPGLIEEQYAKDFEDVLAFRKSVEHKEIKDIKGTDLDAWIVRAEKFVEAMEKLLAKLEVDKKAYDIKKNYEVMIKASVAALKSINHLPPEPENLPKAFKQYLVEAGLVAPWYADVFGRVVEMRKLLEDKKMDKISDRDVYMSKEYVRRFILDVRKVIEKGKPAKEEARLPELPPEKIEEAERAVETAKEMEKLPAIDEKPTPKAEEIVERAEKKIEKAQKKRKKPA
jgi:predicted nucleotidyltransferase/uncharacterized protein (UPF0332 family)